jgi:hypothetical protein
MSPGRTVSVSPPTTFTISPGHTQGSILLPRTWSRIAPPDRKVSVASAILWLSRVSAAAFIINRALGISLPEKIRHDSAVYNNAVNL